MDKYVEHVMEMIASGGIDKEKLKSKLISNWSELEIKAERLIKEMNEILKEAGATETQIEWGIDLPTLSWKEEKRMCQLETCANWRQNLRMCLLRWPQSKVRKRL